MKTKNLIVSIIALLCANIVYFLWMPYPKSFLKTVGNSTFIFDLITNLIFFTIFTVILLVSVNSVAKAEGKLTMKSVSSAIVLSIAVQLVCDVLRIFAEQLLRLWAPLSNDFITVLALFILTLVILNLLKIKDINRKKFYAVFLPVAVIVLAILFVFDIQDILNVKHATEKYVFNIFDTELKHEANAIVANTEFVYEIRNAILDFLTCAAIMIALYFSAESSNIEDEEKYYTKKARFAARIASVIVLSLFVCGIKMIALPHNSMKETHMPQTHSETTLPVFGYNRTQIIHSRTIGYDGTLKPVYNATHSYILYGNEIILEFDMNRECDSFALEKIDVNGTECYIACYDKAAAYLKSGVPYALEIEDIADEEYDEILLGICEKLLEEKSLSCFDCIGEYILKYDSDFIMPYLQRYIASDFTAEELSQNGEISMDYITKTAQRFYNSLSA